MERVAVIIPSHPRFRPWLDNLLASLDTSYEVVVVFNSDVDNRFEMRAVEEGLSRGFDEFFVLQDTTVVKDNGLFRVLFEEFRGRTVVLSPLGQMFLIKFRREHLLGFVGVLPVVRDKWGAVAAEQFMARVAFSDSPVVLCPELVDGDRREWLFGRDNMVLECRWLKKYKGCWAPSMIAGGVGYDARG